MLRGLVLGLAVASVGPAVAASLRLLPVPLGTTELLLSDTRSGFGLDGYDPVSYLLDEQPRAGTATHEAIFGGVAWRFASEANRVAFLREPAAFLPRLGGYDAAGLAAGRLTQPDPTVFAIRDARIYLFRHASDRDRFLHDEARFAAAEHGWEAMRLGLLR